MTPLVTAFNKVQVSIGFILIFVTEITCLISFWACKAEANKANHLSMVRHLAEKWKQWLYQFHFFLEESENKKLQRKKTHSTHTQMPTAVCGVPTAIKGPCSTPTQAERGLTRSGGFQTKRCILLIADELLQSDRQYTAWSVKCFLLLHIHMAVTSSNHSCRENSGWEHFH